MLLGRGESSRSPPERYDDDDDDDDDDDVSSVFLSRSSSLCIACVRHLKIRFIHRIFAVWLKHRSYFRPDLKPIRTLRCVFCA